MKHEMLKKQILELTRQYAIEKHSEFFPNKINSNNKAINGAPYSGRVFNECEVEAAVDSCLDFWLTLGKNGDIFEKKLSKYLGIRRTILANSGSSANLLAISALSSYKLKERQLKRGDEIITAAAGFPTTVAPIVQNGFIPVFVDINPETLNCEIDKIKEAYVEGKTKAIMLAHTLGNPFNLKEIFDFCKEKNLWLIEDNCDSLGSLYNGKLTGSFGDISTQSFYPPHHITLGEGGSINIKENSLLSTIVESFRDWGRDCWCPSGCDNTCGKRYDWQLGELPEGYDHKFIYSHIGYNLKPLDIQAAIGIKQLDKLPSFVKSRKENWNYLRSKLDNLSEYLSFMLPTHAKSWSIKGFEWDDSNNQTEPSWFGFMINIKKSAPFKKPEFARYLESVNIGNRNLFGGNLTRQPAFINLIKENPNSYRVVNNLDGADKIMNEALFIGVYPGLTFEHLDYIVEKINIFIKKY
jgi:CDP-6-deoxy-D-xylo-4-hexulose-3-dehydrase